MKRDARTKAVGYAANTSNESVFQAILYLISQGKHQEAERLAIQHSNRHGANNARPPSSGVLIAEGYLYEPEGRRMAETPTIMHYPERDKQTPKRNI